MSFYLYEVNSSCIFRVVEVQMRNIQIQRMEQNVVLEEKTAKEPLHFLAFPCFESLPYFKPSCGVEWWQFHLEFQPKAKAAAVRKQLEDQSRPYVHIDNATMRLYDGLLTAGLACLARCATLFCKNYQSEYRLDVKKCNSHPSRLPMSSVFDHKIAASVTIRPGV